MRAVWMSVVLGIGVCGAARAEPRFSASGLEARLGMFIQSRSVLFSGGAAWAPHYRLANLGEGALLLEGRAGAWILADQGSNPAFSPYLGVGVKAIAPPAIDPIGKLSVSILTTGGFAFVVDRPILEASLTLAKEFESRPFGLESIGLLGGALFSTGPVAFFVGTSCSWRW